MMKKIFNKKKSKSSSSSKNNTGSESFKNSNNSSSSRRDSTFGSKSEKLSKSSPRATQKSIFRLIYEKNWDDLLIRVEQNPTECMDYHPKNGDLPLHYVSDYRLYIVIY